MLISTESFQRILYSWHSSIERNMPWKNTKDPYKIWVSEIILQQTRVEYGIKYFEEFIKKFPTVFALSEASEDDVLATWQGLGYYSRARNLHHAAKTVANEYGGIFPSDYSVILSLPGIGPYTAAAIASFAFDQPYAVLDGNVFRVLSRILGEETPIDSAKGKKIFAALSENYLDAEQAAKYNQAIMDFGALQCSPKAPKCTTCPFSNICVAFSSDIVSSLPRKEKTITVKERHFHYFIALSNDKIFLEKRNRNDIWKGLYEPLCIETSQPRLTKRDLNTLVKKCGSDSLEYSFLDTRTQRLTHQLINGHFYTLHHSQLTPNSSWIQLNDIKSYGMPKIIVEFLKMHITQVQV